MHVVLIAEDDPIQRRMVRRMLEEDLAVEVVEAPNGENALKQLKSDSPRIGLLLVDLEMPVLDGMSLLRQARKLKPQLPCMVLTGSERVEDAVEAMQLGAVDFITKPAQRERLVTSVKNALALGDLKEEVNRLQHDRTPHYSFQDITGVTPGLSDLAELGQKAAGSEIPVLITGESGVGKEVFARAIHRESARSEKPFVAVNCGALPDNLVESVLFGHEKGAFTGAIAKSIGKCREADGGVLFLDEIGELKPDAQVKLLRMLQQGEIEPVGSGKPMKIDVRVISATNRSLEKLIGQGRFREDLYYRLQGLPLHITPLRERPKDIPSLADHLLTRLALSEKRESIRLSPEAMAWLAGYRWPGNVRELQHVLHRAVLLTESDVIQPEDLSRWAEAHGKAVSSIPRLEAAAAILLEGKDGQFKTLEQIEQEAIEAAMAKHNGHIGQAAAALGIGQSTLYKRIQKRA